MAAIKHWRWFFVAMAYILASPFLLIWGVIKGIRYIRTLTKAVTPAIVCSNCHHPVSLVGLWRCGCGFTYRGHLLHPCSICHRVPRVVRCHRCNVTTRLA